ncbi:Ca2+-transporting ATPase [Tissierella praeacuta DSM 18095]|uniref:P-type Ca(2+) transporter n=1 Tax=Tissierella praeacuta DSM 18095 TaxID=1123404 RepID=A0A1M4YZ26_9FIRM|nr:calcium-transporting P-type ATPase, PMR1-type [Tissierella praeacuta]SHF10807.1 Ca2+-transporting ATPase [Tissierella praeacuta DSM 18095]SUP04910.1 Calcium-transporting ATPase [Tissierella praeacuta]
MKEWYSKSKEEILSELNTNLNSGLTKNEVDLRLEKYGSNDLREEDKKSFFSKIVAQFSDFLILILIGAAIISFAVGESKDAIVIIAIVMVNAFLGIYQEGRAEKALDALKKMSSPNAKVIRDGTTEVAPASSLVPGDIVVLDAGDIIPADLRLVESSNLKIEEASLTGESVPVEKDSNVFFEEEVSLGDRKNMAYMSTAVTYGRGKGVVVGTGHDTEIGNIATMIQSFEDEVTPLQKQLNQLGKVLGITTIIICIAVFGIGLIQNREVLEMFMVAISLAVAAIPEGLPAIVTIVLAIGMNRMVKRNAIVKKLLAVETLGSTTVICSDKTGTLTQNEMTVVKVFTDGKIIDVTGGGYEPVGEFKIEGNTINVEDIGDFQTLLSISALANDANLEKTSDGYKVIGDPTEGALITLAGKGNINKQSINKEFPRIEEIPFDSDRKMMTTFHKDYIPNKVVSFTKGAPDIIINRCTRISMDGKILDFDDTLKKEVLKVNSIFSKKALRVLAFAYKEYNNLPNNISTDSNEVDMTFIGLVGMIDPARPEAKDAIAKCKEAGIKTIMITGDYKETAFAIAKELGMAESIDQAMMGEELNKISDEELREVVKNIKVYARVSPEHKVRIVSALKANGEITAMTGDGVNDALALKRADIGVSMGITGTDVAKNTAELILTDDNFASIVSAVEEGRIIYSNIKKFVFFLLSCNIGEIFLVFTSILLNLPVPLLAIQLLWLNLVTDSFPALALGVEKGDPDIMDTPPRNPNEPILTKNMLLGILLQSLAVGVAALLAYRWGLTTYADSIDKARTIAFTSLITAELLRAYSSRSQKYTLFKIGFFTNSTLVYGTLFSFILLLGVLYIPFMQPIFHTFALGIKDWAAILEYAFIPLIIGEISKLFIKK